MDLSPTMSLRRASAGRLGGWRDVATTICAVYYYLLRSDVRQPGSELFLAQQPAGRAIAPARRWVGRI
jgi:hypothetical protein